MTWELQILDRLQELRTPVLDWLMPKITVLGNAGILWIALIVVLLCLPKYRRTGCLLIIALLCNVILCNALLKPMAHRIRPYEYRPQLQLLVEKCVDYSFPSGHTSSSFAAVVGLYFAGRKRLWKLALVPAVLIAFSRLYLYVHFPTDVLCGILIGILCGWLGYRIQIMIDKRREKRGNGTDC